MLPIGAAAAALGVCPKTLRRWDAAGTFRPAYRTPGGHRRYDLRAVLNLARDRRDRGRAVHPRPYRGKRAGVPRAAIYARVSSSRQKRGGDLARQVEALEAHCAARGYRVSATYSDVGSGLNDARRGLLRLLRAAPAGRFDVVVATYSDRVARFGLRVVREFLASWGVALELVHPRAVDAESPHAELITDLTAILYSFMGKLYRAPRGRNPVNAGEGEGAPVGAT